MKEIEEVERSYCFWKTHFKRRPSNVHANRMILDVVLDNKIK